MTSFNSLATQTPRPHPPAGSQAGVGGRNAQLGKPQVTSEHGSARQVFPVAIKMYVKYVNRGSAGALKKPLAQARTYTQARTHTHAHTSRPHFCQICSSGNK